MTNVTLDKKYEPLQSLETRYAVITGGRGSGKSFAIATLLLGKTFQHQRKTILFTRYTLTNAEVSVLPEFLSKIELGNLHPYFSKSGNEITNLVTGTKILFRGIKTSTGINTAALKSIPNLVIWCNDESEELTDETVFDTIDFSLRDKESHCEVWLTLNPADVTHFIYRRFFAGNEVEGGYNGVKGDVTYIHTTYLDNRKNLDQDYIDKAERMKDENPQKYRHLFLGEWETNREGLVYHWEKITEAQWPSQLEQWGGLDWGYGDPTAVVRMCYDPLTATLYVREVACEWQSVPTDIAPVLQAETDRAGIYLGNFPIYCDSANPAGIEDLQRMHVDARKADKRDREYQVSWLRSFHVCYIGEHIEKEATTYSFIPSPYDKTVFTRKPQDGNDHFMDAIRYGAFTHLRSGAGGAIAFGADYDYED